MKGLSYLMVVTAESDARLVAGNKLYARFLKCTLNSLHFRKEARQRTGTARLHLADSVDVD
jgi:hypothetical protein